MKWRVSMTPQNESETPPAVSALLAKARERDPSVVLEYRPGAPIPFIVWRPFGHGILFEPVSRTGSGDWSEPTYGAGGPRADLVRAVKERRVFPLADARKLAGLDPQETDRLLDEGCRLCGSKYCMYGSQYCGECWHKHNT